MSGFKIDVATDEAVKKASSDWKQGDVATAPAGLVFVYGVDASKPLTRFAAEAKDSIAREPQDALVVVTQTCDVVVRRSCDQGQFIEMCPLVGLDPSKAGQAKKGKMVRYAPLPEIDSTAFADLSRVMTYEKSALLGWDRRPGVLKPEDMKMFSRLVGRRYSRFAFPNALHDSTKAMKHFFREELQAQSQEAKAIDAVHRILVRATPRWGVDEVHVDLIFCPETERSAHQVCGDEDWTNYVRKWSGLCKTAGEIKGVAGDWQVFETMSLGEYARLDEMDLDHLS